LNIEGLDPAQLDAALKLLPRLPPNEQAELIKLLETVVEHQAVQKCRGEFLPFVKRMWPGFIPGSHHRVIGNAFERIAKGDLKRVTISLPPRFTKSELSSWLLPAWFLGKYPDKKIMQASHKAELAVGFGRKVRDLVGSPDYRDIFPDFHLKPDSKAAGRWNTGNGGSYYATGVGAGLAGFGADLLIIDDPHDEQEAIQGAHNPEIFSKAWDWYQTGPRQRLQPGAAIVIIATRWSKVDLIGRVTQAMIEKEGADQWEVIEIPAILPSGKSSWPEYWSTEELLSTKANIQPVRWNAQYMQNPTGEEGAIVKREWWKRWTLPTMPTCEYVIQSWDTAFRATTRSNFSVCTTLGVFRDDEGIPQIMVLDVWRDRVEFPQLKEKAISLYRDHNPDSCIIEAKANGDALINEMRMMGIPVQDYTPSRGNDKIVRLNAVADLFASGAVWAPNTRWADEMIEEVAEFPYGENDDQVDAFTLGLARFRQGNFVRLPTDEEEDEIDSNARADYYV
jgi:predicted phage terminase large subunit-like protein